MRIYLQTLACILLILTGCTRLTPLDRALELSGDNRHELEKAINFYKHDSLKLHALCFLIENMPEHYFFDGEAIKHTRDSIYQEASLSYYSKRCGDILLSEAVPFKRLSQKVYDIETINADFLIEHIESCFRTRELYPWLRGLDFELFLRYILPYRIVHESIELWQDSLDIPGEQLRKALSNTYYSWLDIENGFPELFSELEAKDENVLSFLGGKYIKGCLERSYLELLKLRALGIPAAVDYIPAYANRNGYHSWVQHILPDNGNYQLQVIENRKAPKVFRRTYARNKIPEPEGNEQIPSVFTDAFNQDVTSSYIHTENVVIHPEHDIDFKVKHAYLTVFNNLEWKPVWWCEYDKNILSFENMGVDVVYLPICYKSNLITPLSFPFRLSRGGGIHYFKPDTTLRETIKLERKYPISPQIKGLANHLQGLKFEACNDISFLSPGWKKNTKRDEIGINYVCQVEDSTRFRYWRCLADSVEIAELIFKDSTGNELNGRVMPSGKSKDTYAGFDHYDLSNMTVVDYIIVDFGKPVRVKEILCLPRGDGNGIFPGREYELCYFDQHGWVSLGKKKATDFYLEFENVPSGALLWLHNLNQGVEDRIFTCENGVIHFW